MELDHEDRWVAGRLATLDPQWRPDFARGRELLEAGLAERTYRRPWMAAVLAAGMCVAAVALPQTRAFGEELWYRFVLNRVDVVRLDLSALPLHVQVTTNGLEQAAQDLDDAERKAGFRPYLPAAGVLQTNPALTVTGPISVEQTIHAGDIEAALHKVGALDVQVPAEWEGTLLRTEIGPVVAADYTDGVRILQMQPIAVSVPTGFPLERFAEVAFRSIGVSTWEAQALARKFAANPAWLLDIPAGEAVNIREVSLGKGHALLIEDLDGQGTVTRTTVIRSTGKRIYSASANSAELSMRIADALP